MREPRTCPITGLEAEYEPPLSSGFGHRYYQQGGLLTISEGAVIALHGGLWAIGETAFSATQLAPAKALMRSKFWRATKAGERLLFVATRNELMVLEVNGAQAAELHQRFYVIALEDGIAEAAQLTFTQKALNTLENLHDIWLWTGAVPAIPCAALDDKQHSWYQSQSVGKEDGMAYGCDERSAPMVYQWLQEQGFLEDRIVSGQWRQRELTPAALVEVEKIKAGREASLKRGFFIRRFDPDTDAFFRPLLDEVAKATGCEISAVWERQKNEKLDELILRRIREASVIVLDVTGERFNVGLEAGYALALRKQIIVLRDKSEKDGDLPFDIRTMNCFFYDRNKAEELEEKLRERVLDALEEARIGTH